MNTTSNSQMSNIKFITGNKNKLKEARQAVPHLEQLDIDLLEIQSLNPKEIIEHKLKEAKKLGHTNFFVEDISLSVDKYGFPGPLIKWVNQTMGHDFGVYFEGESATILCSIGYCDSLGEEHYFEGSTTGTICRARGEDFGFNPIFIPNGYDKTYAELSLEEKGRTNHRAKALNKLKEFIEKNYSK
ncbi:MAG: non-canonical purine NTP pyrophosphatase [Nanoarchaeota archaeon]|nr:non-canonical purine NTP pyrophosphatase [Nanoarchaeota archaeon]